MPETLAEETALTTYRVDPRSSRFTVQAFAEGLLSAFGHNPRLNAGDFSGEVKLPGDDLDAASLQFRVKAESLQVIDKVSDKDRRELERTLKKEVLETSRFPDITFVSQTVRAMRIYEGFYRLAIGGRLSLHGLTRDHEIEAQVRLMEDSLRAEGESRLLQTNYGIRRVSIAAGTLKVKDEVKLSFDIVAGKAVNREP